MDNNTTTDFLNLFITTANEHLTRMQQILFSQETSKPEIIEELHRHAHSLKGEFNAMGFVKSGELAHLLELIFANVKSGTATLSPSYVGLLQKSLEQLSSSVQSIAASKTEIDLAAFTENLAKETGINLPGTSTV